MYIVLIKFKYVSEYKTEHLKMIPKYRSCDKPYNNT